MSVTIKEKPPEDASYCPPGLVVVVVIVVVVFVIDVVVVVVSLPELIGVQNG